MPIPIHDIVGVLDRFAAHLARPNERGKRRRQLDMLRELLSSDTVAPCAAAG
jgi:hypothetical protein